MSLISKELRLWTSLRTSIPKTLYAFWSSLSLNLPPAKYVKRRARCTYGHHSMCHSSRPGRPGSRCRRKRSGRTCRVADCTTANSDVRSSLCRRVDGRRPSASVQGPASSSSNLYLISTCATCCRLRQTRAYSTAQPAFRLHRPPLNYRFCCWAS